MKTKYPNLFGILAVVMLVASFVVPINLVSPSTAQADPGICKWDTLREPGSLTGTEVIARNTDILDLAVGNDFNTVIAVVDENLPTYVLAAGIGGPLNLFKWSGTKGVFWSGGKYLALTRHPNWGLALAGRFTRQCYQVALAPDNPNFYAVTTDAVPLAGPREVWVTTDGGSTWNFTNLAVGLPLAVGETIRCIDVSVDYGGKRDIVIGTTTGIGGGRLIAISSVGFAGWRVQIPAAGVLGFVDYFAVKFSPSYASDQSIAIVFADAIFPGCPADIGGTWYNIAFRDVATNAIVGFAYPPVAGPPLIAGIEVKDPTQPNAASPSFFWLDKACIALPSDFSGQAASLRRSYISLDSFNAGAALKAGCARDGIFRIDDTSVYVLMDTSQVADKSIYSIAYFGTYASGKLLAGERMGYPCTAQVPTWFTDSPTTCPVPCWYPALKPTTGAAAVITAGKTGVGAALVAWAPQGNLAYVATGSQAYGLVGIWFLPLLGVPLGLDESAVAISRNNGETWNQISLIDTYIFKFTDIAPTPDCKTIYLASVNNWNNADTGAIVQASFDSVWRTSSNGDVVSPMSMLPVGTTWERVFTHLTRPDCAALPQTEWAILRLVPYCADPTGEIVGWAAYDPFVPGFTAPFFVAGIAAWSPDYGDYWAMINPRHSVQDFCFESRTVMYFLNGGGLVQKMPYTGTAWASTIADVDTGLAYGAHTIAAYPEGKVVVGASQIMNGAVMATSFCPNFNTDTPAFAPQLLSGRTNDMGTGRVHVAFDPQFKDNGTYFIGVDNAGGACTGSVYRNKPSAQLRWADTNMMALVNGAIPIAPVGAPPHPFGQFGIAIAFTGQALYTAHTWCATVGPTNWGVDRTIDDGTGKYGPLSGMPKPGIAWDHLDTGLPALAAGPLALIGFSGEPSSLKLCGCCTLDTDTTLYAIDNYMMYSVFPPWPIAAYTPSQTGFGLIWSFTDCMAKKGPALVTDDQTLIGCDPVSGRAQEVNLCWQQLCVASGYDLEISKNKDFSIKVIDIMAESVAGAGLVPVDLQTPCVFFPAGGSAQAFAAAFPALPEGSAIGAFGNLECGHTYFWRVKVRQCATTQLIRSPWSEVRSFTVKSGLPVVSTYLGLTLLSPNNGCIGCPATNVSFSWSPFKETNKYEIILAKDPGLTQVIKQAQTTTTAYEYDGKLEYSTNYFWQVKGIDPPSDPSATFSFRTEAAPAGPPLPTPPAPPPFWVWVVIGIGTILVIVTLVLIFKTRRV